MVDKEKMAEWAKNHAGHMFMGGMAVLLALRLAVMFLGGSGAPLAMPSVKKIDLQPTLTESSDLYKKVRKLIDPPSPFIRSPYRQLAEFNMFDPRMAQNADQIRKQADQSAEQARKLYEQALAAIKTGDHFQAESLLSQAAQQVREALDRQPSHAAAQQLLLDIDNQRAAARKKQEAAKNGQPAQGQPSAAAKP